MILLAVFVTFLTHVGDDIETKFTSVGVFTVMFANHSDEGFGKADEADRKSTVFNNIAKRIVWFEFLRAHPVALAHEEWEVANVLVGLEFEALEKFVADQIHLLVELFVEAFPISLFAFFGSDTMFDTDTNKVQSGERKVTAAGDDTIRFWENRSEDAGAAAHGSDFGAIVTWFVILEVVWCIDKAEVREQALGGYFHRKLEEVVVWIAWVVVDSLFNLED